MRRQNFYIREFRCPDCGFKRPATKRLAKKTRTGHIKDMWCPRCNEIKKFVQME